jgi:hypothetical protein
MNPLSLDSALLSRNAKIACRIKYESIITPAINTDSRDGRRMTLKVKIKSDRDSMNDQNNRSTTITRRFFTE